LGGFLIKKVPEKDNGGISYRGKKLKKKKIPLSEKEATTF